MVIWSCTDVKLRKMHFADTDALLLQSHSCLYLFGIVFFAKVKHLLSQGGKNRGRRVREQEQYCHCLA